MMPTITKDKAIMLSFLSRKPPTLAGFWSGITKIKSAGKIPRKNIQIQRFQLW